jgi:hypothetical protein
MKRPNNSVSALSATPSRMPAKIRNSVPEKYQAKPTKIAKDTVAMPPAVIAQAGHYASGHWLLRARWILCIDWTFTVPSIASGIKTYRRFDVSVAIVHGRWGRPIIMNMLKWVGPLGLLAALVIGDQIRINRPAHKYRLTMEVETPDGVKSASNVVSVHPYRGYQPAGKVTSRGDAVVVDLGGGRNLAALMLHDDKGSADFDGANFVAMRAYQAAGRKIAFRDVSSQTGAVPVTGELMPVLASFTDPRDASTACGGCSRMICRRSAAGTRLRGVTVEAVPNGLWPIDFGGGLGEPVTRGVTAKLPWAASDGQAARALAAIGFPNTPEPAMALARK